jgi:protein-S-isoprenylcysteine O-methyltransferase Ste14
MSVTNSATRVGTTTSGSVRLGRVLDWTERVLLLMLCVWFMFRILSAWMTHGGMANLILLPSECVVVFFVLIRRSTDAISRRPHDWMLAFLASVAPLLVFPDVGHGLAPPAMAATLMIMGMFVQLHAKLSLGRSFGLVAANRGLQFSGPYQYVRHPMYMGYLLTHVGFFLMNPTSWNVGIYVLCYVAQIWRLLVEERLLREDPRYSEYMTHVRYRLVPGVF